MDIVDRLESHNVYCEDCDSKQLRKDAAEEIRELRILVDRLAKIIDRTTAEPA